MTYCEIISITSLEINFIKHKFPDMTVFVSDMAGVIKYAGTTHPSRPPEFTPVFLVRSVLHV